MSCNLNVHTWTWSGTNMPEGTLCDCRNEKWIKPTATPSPEIRPCPFCGKKADFNKYGRFISCNCTKTKITLDTCTSWEKWQNAYCWKEIDRLTQQLQEKESDNNRLRNWRNAEQIRNTLYKEMNKLIDEKDALIAKMREALQKIDIPISPFHYGPGRLGSMIKIKNIAKEDLSRGEK